MPLKKAMGTVKQLKNKLIVLFTLLLTGSFYFSCYGMKTWGISVRRKAGKRPNSIRKAAV